MSGWQKALVGAGVVIVLCCYVMAAALCRASADADRRLDEEARARGVKSGDDLTDEQVEALWRGFTNQAPRRRYRR